MNSWQRFWQYVTDCARLLYWTYFKPFTFNHWLKQEIHPNLTFTDSPFQYRQEFAANPKLHRYANQVIWITLVVPIVITALVAISYNTLIFSLLVGWTVGAFLAKAVTPLERRLRRLIRQFDDILIESMWKLDNEWRGLDVVNMMGRVAYVVMVGVAFTVSWLLGILRLCFWLPEAIWMLILRLRYSPQSADQALHWLPPYFDELIYFPLPFMSQLITEAHRVNSLAARQTLDHFTNFTNQQAVVGTVILRIALDTLHRCQTEYDIAHVATDQLDWIPDPAPAALGTSLPKCLDISRDVRTAHEATTPYRHKELLTKPLNDLIQLRRQLGFEQNSAITTALGQITQHWLGILEKAHKTLTEQIQQSGELPSGAYIAGSSLDPATADQNFRGRQDLFAEIENVMLATQPPILLLYGSRRSGKTSALKYLPKRTGTALVPLLIDLQQVAEVSTLMGVAESMANQMIDFARTTRNMTLPRYDTDALRQDPFHALRQWFKQIEQTFPDKRFLLCLDEFERLEEVVTATGSRAPLNFLRATFQHHPCWVVLFAGAHQPTELADYWSDYLINTRTLRLSYLQESEARELIEKPSGDFPEKVYDPAAIESIVYQTHCQPYLVQLLCQNVIEYLNQDKRRYAQLEDVTAAIPHAIERGGQYFRELWKHTLKNATDREIIRKVLAGQSLLAEETQRIPYLVDKEIIEKTASGYRLQVPLVATALRGYNTASFR